ncbi:mono/diheme cytochrome c family protein [Novosphingobium chloroacetimidivorans]|uniref:Mono/diheme cytochrome c family protein n=1 Tax=Novosphingobium chloroacetimidivorans TaxID=1428314 RepID=A0A7W7K8S7_9SPHN|nr:hypothetical protein [Novosphingobium chloroacetimidivorans]MBB4857638.1 mono/diheme cytochrome c family protein [Novosphingobium chloroacetimidivorans]
MTLTHQRPLAILFAAAITFALWSPTLSGPLPQSAAATHQSTSTMTRGAVVFAAAPSSPVLM